MLSFVHGGIRCRHGQRIGPSAGWQGSFESFALDTPALRLDDLTKHPASVGFPEHHPAMRAFLGVPITIRGKIFGNLYLTHDEPGRLFSESDEFAARGLAFAAAVAIDNAQIFERERMSVKWMEASREITTALLSGPSQALHPCS